MTQFTRSGPHVETARYARTRIAVVRGPDAGLAVEAAGRTVLIGTADECDLKLTDDTVSRRHCEIELTESGFRVRDSGSTNGVRCAGMRMFDMLASGPLELSIGETTLSVTPLGQTEDRERAIDNRFYGLLGGSRKMRELFARLEQLANSNLSVLIEGETGSGKDVVAETLHAASPRAKAAFIVFDCSAVAPNLVESELFGHERGAFTGAVTARAGVFEEADGGTLFLDEIGELPKELQPKLLRALEKREVKRVGGRAVTSVDVRVLAATNRNLVAEVRAGNFREDLFYRIAGEQVVVPALRERKEDIPLLVEHFLKLDAPKLPLEQLPQQVWDMFNAHRWPGNVRELRNAVQRLVIAPERALQHVVRDADSGAPTSRAAREDDSEPTELLPLRIARSNAVDAFERAYLNALLKRTQGNVMRAAAVAEVSRTAVQKLMAKHDIKARES
jgi:two-component system, NtrC family, response regulator GlrR